MTSLSTRTETVPFAAPAGTVNVRRSSRSPLFVQPPAVVGGVSPEAQEVSAPNGVAPPAQAASSKSGAWNPARPPVPVAWYFQPLDEYGTTTCVWADAAAGNAQSARQTAIRARRSKATSCHRRLHARRAL